MCSSISILQRHGCPSSSACHQSVWRCLSGRRQYKGDPAPGRRLGNSTQQGPPRPPSLDKWGRCHRETLLLSDYPTLWRTRQLQLPHTPGTVRDVPVAEQVSCARPVHPGAAQRDQILALAHAVPFCKKSCINSCRTWTRLLLEAMVNANLLSATLFEHLDTDILLKKPLPELSESEQATT